MHICDCALFLFVHCSSLPPSANPFLLSNKPFCWHAVISHHHFLPPCPELYTSASSPNYMSLGQFHANRSYRLTSFTLYYPDLSPLPHSSWFLLLHRQPPSTLFMCNVLRWPGIVLFICYDVWVLSHVLAYSTSGILTSFWCSGHLWCCPLPHYSWGWFLPSLFSFIVNVTWHLPVFVNLSND